MLGFLKSAPSNATTDSLAGPTVYLREQRAGDFRAWSDIRGVSRRFLEPWEATWPSDALTRGAFRRRLRRQTREARDNTGYSFFVFRNAGDVLVGGISLNNMMRGISMSCGLGYWVGEAHARQGVMTEALGCLLPFVFDTLGMHRLEAACLPENEPSQRLLRKLGFHEEGYARGYLRIDGRWHDHLLFAMLVGDYKER